MNNMETVPKSRQASTPRRYSALQLVSMTEDRLVEVIAADYSALVTISIEQAVHPDRTQHVARILRSPQWCAAWMDALLCAEGSLQVSLERMTYENDGRGRAVDARLRAVRKMIASARELVQSEQRANSLKEVREADPEHTARQWLIAACLDEFREFRAAYLATVDATEFEADRISAASGVILAACQSSDLVAPVTVELKELMRLDAEGFRNTVAKDAQSSNDRNEALRHPLALTKWLAALDELLDMTYERAQAESVRKLGSLRADLWAMQQEEVYLLLNARRFFAAVLQRRTECENALSRTLEGLGEDAQHFLTTRQFVIRETSQRFAEAKKVEYAHILGRLSSYCDENGLIDPDLLSRSQRGILKREILAELGQVAPSEDQIREAVAPRVITPIKKQVAYALAAMDLEICHRATIRAMLPPGRTRTGASAAARRASGCGASINVISVKFKDALHELEELGFIQRGQEFVRVVARQKLYDYALAGLDRLPDDFVNLRAAEAATQRVLDSEGAAHSESWVEQRSRELAKLRQLMAAPTATPPRIVHRSGRQERLEVGQFRTGRKP